MQSNFRARSASISTACEPNDSFDLTTNVGLLHDENFRTSLRSAGTPAY